MGGSPLAATHTQPEPALQHRRRESHGKRCAASDTCHTGAARAARKARRWSNPSRHFGSSAESGATHRARELDHRLEPTCSFLGHLPGFARRPHPGGPRAGDPLGSRSQRRAADHRALDPNPETSPTDVETHSPKDVNRSTESARLAEDNWSTLRVCGALAGDFSPHQRDLQATHAVRHPTVGSWGRAAVAVARHEAPCRATTSCQWGLSQSRHRQDGCATTLRRQPSYGGRRRPRTPVARKPPRPEWWLGCEDVPPTLRRLHSLFGSRRNRLRRGCLSARPPRVSR